MAVHFVADLHFNGTCARHAHPHGFADSAEMTRRICETWRARVAPEDTVWILGNVGNPVHLLDLPGTKHLVRGAFDPPLWNCLTTGRYASVSDQRLLETDRGVLLLTSDPTRAWYDDGLVLHGRVRGGWSREGHVCVSADQAGWGPISLDQLTGETPDDLRHAA